MGAEAVVAEGAALAHLAHAATVSKVTHAPHKRPQAMVELAQSDGVRGESARQSELPWSAESTAETVQSGGHFGGEWRRTSHKERRAPLGSPTHSPSRWDGGTERRPARRDNSRIIENELGSGFVVSANLALSLRRGPQRTWLRDVCKAQLRS